MLLQASFRPYYYVRLRGLFCKNEILKQHNFSLGGRMSELIGRAKKRPFWLFTFSKFFLACFVKCTWNYEMHVILLRLSFFYLVRWDPRPPIFVFYGCEVLSHHNPQPKKCKIPTLFCKLKGHDFAWSSTKLWRRMYVVALWICNANILSIWRFLQSPIFKQSLKNVGWYTVFYRKMSVVVNLISSYSI